MRATRLVVVITAVLVASACSAGGDDDPNCNSGKCDDAGDFRDQLAGRDDPIARFLATLSPDPDGLVSLTYNDVVEAVAKIQGCDATTWKAFIVSDPLVEGEPFPRVVTTVCANNAVKASEFFIAASFKDPDTDDVDDVRLEMFAWDATARLYRFYATERAGDKVEVEVEPDRCRECHLAPTNLSAARSLDTDGRDITTGQMRMTPIMNELTQPWSHWNSQVPMFNTDAMPFPSHDFEVPQDVRLADNFIRLGFERAAEAQRFEQIIREGHARVTGARARERRDKPGTDWRPAMNLLRPLFCEEQVQYATEDFESGLIQVTAVIPGGMREAFGQLRPSLEPVDWPWGWLNNQDGRMRLARPETRSAIFMMPIRGNADVDYENRVVAARALGPMDVIRVRALDWKHPVFSEFRCNLWKDAVARFEDNPPQLNADDRNSSRMRALFDATMEIGGIELLPVSADQVIALDVASEQSVTDMLEAVRTGALADAQCTVGQGFCSIDVHQLGAILDAHVTGFEQDTADAVRSRLSELRDERLCHVLKFFRNAPHLPPVECQDEPGPDPGAGSFAGENSAPAAIPDNDPGGVRSDISAAGSVGLNVNRVQVFVEIEHTWRGDLKITLTPPGGQDLDVVAFDPDDSQDDVSARFDITGVEAGLAGDGVWTLRVEDRAGADTGTLKRWSLGINEPAP